MVALIREDLRTPLFRLMAGVILIFLKSAIYLFCTTTKKINLVSKKLLTAPLTQFV